jgi:hypothetical protein
MNTLLLALAFLGMPDETALPTRMSLDEPARDRQDVETDRQRPDESSRLTPMEFIYRHSEFEVGSMYTDFDNSLGLRSHLGFYVRWGVEVIPNLAVHLTYRYNEFGSGPSAPAASEDVRLQTLLIGATYHFPLSKEFAVLGGIGIGPSWWDSSALRSETAFLFSAEIGATARLWEMLRLKAGIVFDAVNTDFHSASGTSVNLSYLVGLEIGL